MRVGIASTKPNRGARDFHLYSRSAEDEEAVLAASRPRSACRLGDDACGLASSCAAHQAQFSAIGAALGSEMTVGEALDQLLFAAGARADVVAVIISTDFAHGRLLTVGFAVLLALLAARAGDAIYYSVIAAEDGSLPFASCVGRTGWAERARNASADDEATGRATLSARRAENAAVDGRHPIFAAADEAVSIVARAQGPGVSRAKGGGEDVVSRVKAQVDGCTRICLEEAIISATLEPALDADRRLTDARRIMRSRAARDERTLGGELIKRLGGRDRPLGGLRGQRCGVAGMIA